MPIQLSETPTESFKSAWSDMVEAIEPDIDVLPEPWKSVFQGPIQLLISSNLSLGITPERRLWAVVQYVKMLYDHIKYPDFFDYNLEYLSSEIGYLFSFNNIGMSKDGRFLLEGPMSRSYVQQTSRMIQQGIPPASRKTRGGEMY